MIATKAGYPPLEFMEGFFYPGNVMSDPFYWVPEQYKSSLESIYMSLPIKWDAYDNPLNILLRHSDCGGEIEHKYLMGIATELKKIVPLLPDEDTGGHIGNWREKTNTFIEGLERAYNNGDNIEFG